MKLRPIEKTSATTRVFEALHEMIATGRFPRGEKLPSQEELARQLGVSRNTLREAVNKLATMGLLVSRQGVGTVVEAPSPGGYLTTLSGQFLLDPLSVREFIEARICIERTTVRLAVARAQPRDLRQLQEILEAQHKALRRCDVDPGHLDPRIPRLKDILADGGQGEGRRRRRVRRGGPRHVEVLEGAQVVVNPAAGTAHLVRKVGEGIDETDVLPSEGVALEPGADKGRGRAPPAVSLQNGIHVIFGCAASRHEAFQALRAHQRREGFPVGGPAGDPLRQAPGPEQFQDHSGRQEPVAARGDAHVGVGPAPAAVAARGDRQQPGAPPAGLLHRGRQVQRGARQVLSPVDDGFGPAQVLEGWVLARSEIGQAGRVAGGVAQRPARGGGAQGGEKALDPLFDHPLGPASLDMQQRAGGCPAARDLPGATLQGLLPPDRMPGAAPAQQGPADAFRALQAPGKPPDLAADQPGRDRMLRVAPEGEPAVRRPGYDQGAGVGAVEGAGRPDSHGSPPAEGTLPMLRRLQNTPGPEGGQEIRPAGWGLNSAA